MKYTPEQLMKFIAWIGTAVVEDIYNDPHNRQGLAHDCFAVSGEDMALRWLEADWQSERAAKAEADIQNIVKKLKELEKQADELHDQLQNPAFKVTMNHLIGAIENIISEHDDDK